MAITSTSRDVRYPSVGDKITIACVYTVGNRFRCRLTNKPVDSALVVYTEANGAWLTNNEIVPDAVGRYTVEVVEETVTNPVPRFSNDLGNGQCVETTTPVATATHYVTVAGKVKRQIGFSPDDATLELYATVDDYAGGTTGGALTRYTDATRCPILTNPGSDAAKIAMAYDSTARQVAEIGGYGSATPISGVRCYKYGDRADQTAPVMTYTSIEDSSILATFEWTIKLMNDHIEATQIRVHGAADAANVITSPVAAVGNEPSQRVLLNEILTNLAAHAAIGGGGVHHDADTITTGLCGALAALPNPSTMQQRIDRTRSLFNIMDAHFTRTWLSTSWATYIHNDGADNHLDYEQYYPPYDDASVVACANHMRTTFGTAAVAPAHLGNVTLCAALYHAIAGTFDSTYLDTMPVDAPGLVTGVRKALQVLHAHVTNIQFTSGAPIVYHTAADWGSRTDVIPGPSDYVGAINALEALRWTLGAHAQHGLNTHNITHQGNWKTRPFGVEAIHQAFRSVATYTGTVVGSSENAAYARLILGGGFSKA